MAKDPLKTRLSLIEKLRDQSDQESWERFYDIYSPLLFRFSRSLGMTASESEDLVQETVISVSKSIGNYRYEPTKCSFKGWLFMIIKRRLIDLRRFQSRRKTQLHDSLDQQEKDIDKHNLVDSGYLAPDQELWESDWELFVRERAYEILKKTAKIEHLQVFDLSVNKGLEVAEISRFLEISKASVYLILHRMRKTLKKERQTLLEGQI
jgi:RNA polymerase sigma factor (sigma-70 family)